MRKLSLLVCVCIFVVTPAWASVPTPLDYTRTILERARTIVAGGQTHDEKLAALSALFSKFLDTDSMGREALGQHWSSFTPSQQREFLGLFHELLERTYVQKLLLFENPDFVYAGQQMTADGATVDTKIVTPRDEFDVVYHLKPSGDIWLATSIKVEDVSLTSNLGSQLDDLLSRMSVDDLLALMRRKYGNSSGEA
jgi:phospholipid transport system substrate-binding protein